MQQIPLQTHFHPSVSVFAAALLDKSKKVQKPDMESHTLIRFLDKFVYRNPKATDSARGVSIMQPLRAAKDLGDTWLGSRGAGATSAPVNSAAFWNKKAQDVAADEVFFHEYFQNVSKEPKKVKTATDKATDEADEENGEDEIWQALVNSKPDIDDAGSEDGFDDLDELDMDSDGDGDSAALLLDSEDDEEDDDDDGAVDIESDDEEDLDGMMAVDDEQEEDDEKTKNDSRKSRRKMLRGLPIFASAEDYADKLGDDEVL